MWYNHLEEGEEQKGKLMWGSVGMQSSNFLSWINVWYSEMEKLINSTMCYLEI